MIITPFAEYFPTKSGTKLKIFFELGNFFKKNFTDGHITLLNPLILVNFLTRSCILATLK